MMDRSEIAHVGYHLSILTSAMAETIGADEDRQVDMVHLAASEAVAALAVILSLLAPQDMTTEEKLLVVAVSSTFDDLADYDTDRG